jgi:hypothetical protein
MVQDHHVYRALAMCLEACHNAQANVEGWRLLSLLGQQQGVDKVVIRDPLSGRPYVPGSSLKGKMRSQMEKFHGLPQNRRIDQVHIHTCEDATSYSDCVVCHVFGLPAIWSFPPQHGWQCATYS